MRDAVMTSRDRAFHGIHGALTHAPLTSAHAHATTAAAPRTRDEATLATLDAYGSLAEKHHRLTVKHMRALYADVRTRRAFVVDDLNAFQRRAARTGGVNPFDWSDGHCAHFYEFMCARLLALDIDDECEAIGETCDVHALFDSFRADHADRWRPETVVGHDPGGNACARYRAAAAGWCERLLGDDDSRLMGAVETYLHTYAVLHEHWHVEDYVQARNTLCYSSPVHTQGDGGVWAARETYPADVRGGTYTVSQKAIKSSDDKRSNDVITMLGYGVVDVGAYRMGAEKDDAWVFDAERWAHDLPAPKFAIAQTCCTNAQFAAFIQCGGYENRSLWSHEGWRWLTRLKNDHDKCVGPLGWAPFPFGEALADGNAPAYTAWRVTQFDNTPAPLRPQRPVCHVTWYEAEAYCNWIGGRLPTELEWEAAARTSKDYAVGKPRRTYPWGETPPNATLANLDIHRNGTVDVDCLEEGESAYGCRHMVGNVWEWTASAFLPFPGFQMDFPYRENSCPWFGYRKVVKGGCWATSAPIARAGYRHSFWPDMHHTFSGFRVALGAADGLRKRALLVVPQMHRSGAKCGNVVTMERISEHFKANGIDAFTRSIQELPRSSQDMANILKAMHVDFIIVLHAFKCGAVIDAVGEFKSLKLPPVVLILGGTDVNVDAKSSDMSDRLFRERVDIATKVVSFSLSMIAAAPKDSLKFEESDINAKCQLIPQGVHMLPTLARPWTKRKRGESLRVDAGVDDDVPIMFLPGGLRPVKDVCYLSRAFAAYNSSDTRVHLTACGPEMDAKYAKDVRDEYQRVDATLLPGLDREVVLRYIADAKILLNTSVSEGQSGTIAEAMMLGTLVFARDNPGNRHLFDLCEARALATLGPSTAEPIKGDGWELHGVGILFNTPEGCFRALDALGLGKGGSEHECVQIARVRAREGVQTLSENEVARWGEILELL